MGGGLMQLVAYGSQDVYLTGNPQITFFKVVYKRHTNFSMESIQQTFNGSANFGKRVTATISRNGDLIHRMYLEVTLGGFTTEYDNFDKGWCDYVGHALIKNVDIEIGGQQIDKHYGEWLFIWNELTQCLGKKEGHDRMIGSHIGCGTYIGNLATTYNKVLISQKDYTFIDNIKAGSPNIISSYENYLDVLNNIYCTVLTKSTISPLNKETIKNTVLVNAQDNVKDVINAIQYSESTMEFEAETNQGFTPDGAIEIARLITAMETIETNITEYERIIAASLIVPSKTLYIPLKFWFCRNPGLALPLIALQYHEVKLNLEFNSLVNCLDIDISTTQTDAVMTDAKLYVDYIYLDTDERRRFAQTSHEYLIEQLQFTGDQNCSDGNNNFELDLNHPCKELIWVTRVEGSTTTNNWFNFSTKGGSILSSNFDGVNPTDTALLQLNGHDRFSERVGTYFDHVQPYQHHENIPNVPGINVYSFALKPEEHQPSGTCNFSRIDNAVLQVNSSCDGITKIFAVNYNILRIMSGMGGLAFSN